MIKDDYNDSRCAWVSGKGRPVLWMGGAVMPAMKRNGTKTAHRIHGASRPCAETTSHTHTHTHTHTVVWLRIEHWAYSMPQHVVAEWTDRSYPDSQQ